MKTKTGFTLIELLIVIVIIGIVASFAVLTVKVNQTKRLESISYQIVDLFKLAQQEALLRPATLGFTLTPNTYEFYEFHGDKWQLVTDSALKKHSLPNDITLKLKLTNNKKEDEREIQRIIISPGGEVTPFSIFIGKKDQPPLFKIIGSESGEIKVVRQNES